MKRDRKLGANDREAASGAALGLVAWLAAGAVCGGLGLRRRGRLPQKKKSRQSAS